MAIHIRDHETDIVVRRLAEMTGKGLTETIREACEHEIKRLRREKPLMERIRPLLDELKAHRRTGLAAHKAFFDDLSGDS